MQFLLSGEDIFETYSCIRIYSPSNFTFLNWYFWLNSIPKISFAANPSVEKCLPLASIFGYVNCKTEKKIGCCPWIMPNWVVGFWIARSSDVSKGSNCFTMGQKILKSPGQKKSLNQINQFHELFFFHQIPFFAISKMAKNQFLNWEKCQKCNFTEFLFIYLISRVFSLDFFFNFLAGWRNNIWSMS